MVEILNNVASTQQSATKPVYIGKAWKNTSKNGKEFMRLTINRGMALKFNAGDRMELWPNKKREGKQDADFQVLIRVPQTA